MRKMIWLLLFSLLFLCSCENAEKKKSPNMATTEQMVTIEEQEISVSQINSQIQRIFNDMLYYGGPINAEQLLGKNITYDLYLLSDPVQPNYGENANMLYLRTVNLEHPSATNDEPLYYAFGIMITPYGLQSDFCYIGSATEDANSYQGKSLPAPIGQYTMCITQVEEPAPYEHPDQWKVHAEKAIKLFMDQNDLYATPEDNLKQGKYTVYVKDFSRSDQNGMIVFLHESGAVYMGEYRFVNDIQEDQAANLNRIRPEEDPTSQSFVEYLEKIKNNSALVMEYSI